MYYRLYFIFCEADSSTFVGMRVGRTIKKTYDVDLKRSKDYFMEQNKSKNHFRKMCKKMGKYPLVYFKVHFDDYVSDDKDVILDRMQLAHERLGKFLLNDNIFKNEKIICDQCNTFVRKKIIDAHKEKFCSNRVTTCQEEVELQQ